MENIKYYIEDIDAFLVACPACDKVLTELTFFNLALDIYNKKNKMMKIIQCDSNGCTYEGSLMEWVGFVKNF
jgi:hypothetical protein